MPPRKRDVPKRPRSNRRKENRFDFASGIVAAVWMIPPPETVPLHFSQETLLQCIEENREGEEWRLVSHLGFSFAEQREYLKRYARPRFRENYIWKYPEAWMTKQLPPGYHLINFKPKFIGESWTNQETAINEMGGCERAHETVVSEALSSMYMIAGERLLRRVFHWGCEKDKDPTNPDGHRLCVGGFNRFARLTVDSQWADSCGGDSNLGVVIEKRPDIKIGYA